MTDKVMVDVDLDDPKQAALIRFLVERHDLQRRLIRVQTEIDKITIELTGDPA